jgi:branched-chain amino acid transport system permease protein
MAARHTLRDLAIAVVALILLLAVPYAVHSPAFLDFIIRVAAMALFASSLNLLVGGTGLVSFGHGMFYGLGAYAFALLMQRTSLSLPVAALATLAISAAAGLVVGAVCIRLRAIYFAFVTLAVQMLFYSVIITWEGLTGGDQGLQGGIPRRAIFGFDLNSQHHLYVASSIVLIVGLLVLRHVAASPLGASLRMIRDNEQRAAFLGITIWRAKLTAFVIAAVFASLGGILAALFVSGAYPELANWPISGQAIFAVMLGGVSSFLGPTAGAAILLALNDAVTRYTEYSGLVLGLVILFVTLGLRRGVLDVLSEALRRRRTASIAAARPRVAQ